MHNSYAILSIVVRVALKYFTSRWITPPPKSSKLNAAPPPPIAAFGIKGCASPPARPFSFPI
ncbi:hypothetical protein H3S80_00905 [Bartonella sp. M0177]|uniref:hypothetical protein n=1 Tax=Bartonella sp. M0177 TaxID=2750940 RepID=UPI0018DBBB26|nr:hypothetical protein [Bartonella sp. M0177]MBI0002612.1 hypothetical protein [Bartonella sp. M0177]